MNKFILYIIILSTSLLSCQKENMGDCFKSTGKKTIVTRASQPFSRIRMDDGINVYITQSSQTSIEVEGGENLLDNVITELKDGFLIIENRNKCNWVRSFKKEINVYLKIDSLNEIDYSGSGNIILQNTLNVDRFIINMQEASGDVNLDLNCSYLELKIHTGPGKITSTGNTQEMVIYNNGPGFINAQNLSSHTALAINRNTGKIFVAASSNLKAEIFGSGNIYYFGNPLVDFTKNGSGDLVHH